jgi:hypothetical protein
VLIDVWIRSSTNLGSSPALSVFKIKIKNEVDVKFTKNKQT